MNSGDEVKYSLIFIEKKLFTINFGAFGGENIFGEITFGEISAIHLI